MSDSEQKYLESNRVVANELLMRLERRRILRDRELSEDYEHCRRSANDLRVVIEDLMVKVHDSGFLLDALRGMQATCTEFVTAAGIDSKFFRDDLSLFCEQLALLRRVFANNLAIIVEKFGLVVTPNIQRAMNFRG